MNPKKQSASEIEAIEMEADKKRRTRSDGLSLRPLRDRGWVRLGNGSLFLWHTNRKPDEGEAIRKIPRGYFELDGKLFDAEEFRKWLRWA